MEALLLRSVDLSVLENVLGGLGAGEVGGGIARVGAGGNES